MYPAHRGSTFVFDGCRFVFDGTCVTYECTPSMYMCHIQMNSPYVHVSYTDVPPLTGIRPSIYFPVLSLSTSEGQMSVRSDSCLYGHVSINRGNTWPYRHLSDLTEIYPSDVDRGRVPETLYLHPSNTNVLPLSTCVTYECTPSIYMCHIRMYSPYVHVSHTDVPPLCTCVTYRCTPPMYMCHIQMYSLWLTSVPLSTSVIFLTNVVGESTSLRRSCRTEQHQTREIRDSQSVAECCSVLQCVAVCYIST